MAIDVDVVIAQAGPASVLGANQQDAENEVCVRVRA